MTPITVIVAGRSISFQVPFRQVPAVMERITQLALEAGRGQKVGPDYLP